MDNSEQKQALIEKFVEISGENILDCYQCGKCSAGCPCVENMSILPHKIIRKLQLNQINEALHEQAMWKCVSCMTCASRCPRSVSLCNILEALRFLYMDEYGDKYPVESISEKIQKEAPQQAIVSAERKNTD